MKPALKPTQHKLDRRALFASGAAAALLAATGVSALAQPASGGRFRAALSGARRSDTFDARQPMGVFMQVAMVGAIFDTLTEIAADGTLRGELATGWSGSSDAQSWVFELRKGVTFHNGHAFGARDVVASLSLHRDTAFASIRQIVLLGEHRVQIDLNAPNPHFPLLLADPRFVMYPEQAMGRAQDEGIGTGLYRVSRFNPGQQFIGTRVERHYKDGTAGWFDEIELVSVPSAQVRAQALSEHLVDAADLDASFDELEQSGIAVLPGVKDAAYAVWRDVGLPVRLGRHGPLDNLRAAERWWMT
jgi:peptide/nickel transport system substrate-binding protein